jgi:pimeloyl-ACP methyl ester carboxylesterase
MTGQRLRPGARAGRHRITASVKTASLLNIFDWWCPTSSSGNRPDASANDAGLATAQADSQRRFGQESGDPLLFVQHFRGGLDHWDPAVTDGFAESRPAILFDNAGIAGSSAETPNTIDAMADNAVTFMRSLKLSQVDLLGFSIGGYVSQVLAVRYQPSFVA